MDESTPIAWLLLRDGHAVPISGLAPDAIKNARRGVQSPEGVQLKHTSGLNAVVHCLGFNGDFGDYVHREWPRVERVMQAYDLRVYGDLFDVPQNDLMFGLMRLKRRDLADRLFAAGRSKPTRFFTGYGVDWDLWDRALYPLELSAPGDDLYVPSTLAGARRWLMRNRLNLMGLHNFLGDQLLDPSELESFVLETYYTRDARPGKREEDLRIAAKVVEVFRWIFGQSDEGWLQVVPVTDRLAFLKGPHGLFDIVWQDLRTTPPSKVRADAIPFGLHSVDVPGFLQDHSDFEVWNYYRHGAWDEAERHRSEIHYYANGGRMLPDYPGTIVVLEQYLRAIGTYGAKKRMQAGTRVPMNFQTLRLMSGKTISISNLVTVAEFIAFMAETGYEDRREGESWTSANSGDDQTNPCGATFRDALAFVAWKERKLGVGARLMTIDEHREIRPFASDHYRALAQQDFPWENFPPRFNLRSALVWSESRFLEAGPDLPEFPDDQGLSTGSRKRWIPGDRWPPHATWRAPIEWTSYSGVQFIDAWDAYEWCGDGRIAGRYWEGPLGVESWGEYKNSKVSFRLVIDHDITSDNVKA